MQFIFTDAVSMHDFPSSDTRNRVYFGFAGSPSSNIFSQKFPGSNFGSTTQFLMNHLHQLKIRDRDKATFVLHTVKGTVTLDVATAAFIGSLAIDQAQVDEWKYIADYIDKIEKGISRPPFERSLYALYYATAMAAQFNFPQNTQMTEKNQFLLDAYWKILIHIKDIGKTGNYEMPYQIMDWVEDRVLIKTQEEMIANDKDRYFNDIKRSESFEIELPLKQIISGSQTSFFRTNIVALSNPQSRFFKFFARNSLSYPSGEVDSFPMTYIFDPSREGAPGKHVISVPPDCDFNLNGLSEIFEKMEDLAYLRKENKPRATDNPREGYTYNDPWYDERHIQPGRSIIDTPRNGSLLSRNDILEAVWLFGNPLKNILVRYVTSSVFIPLWKSNFNFAKSDWKRISLKDNYGATFLPFVDNIFSFESDIIKSYEFGKPVTLNLDPAFSSDNLQDLNINEEIGIQLARSENLDRCRNLTKDKDVKLYYHQYENNFGLIEVELYFTGNNHDNHKLSITDTQWLEHCISLTPIEKLCPGVSFLSAPQLRKSLLFPKKHFITSTLTEFCYLGSLLTNGRSTGGGLQMMINDAEPVYKNLPLNKKLQTEQTIVDEISKRHYYASASSLLNFDDSASLIEHLKSHQNARTLFNMTLAQRFILSQSRVDILNAEKNYLIRKKMNFGKWVGSWFRIKHTKEAETSISKLREDILHLVTSSWFGVVSSNRDIQKVFEALRREMKIDLLYEEVKDRCTDLDEFISNKQAETQNRVFNIFTFILSPLNLVMGFTAGFQFSGFDQPFPFIHYSPPGWVVFLIYFSVFSVIFGGVWLVYKWMCLKE